MAASERRVNQLEMQLEAARPRKRKRVRTSPNSKFVNIEAIWQAQNEANGAEIEQDNKEGSNVSITEGSCIEV